MPRTRTVAATVFGAMAAVAVLVVPGASGAVQEVVIRDGQFQPQKTFLGEGDTLLFIHDDGNVAHTVTADDGSFDSSPNCTDGSQTDCLEAGESWKREFTTTGRFPYHSKTNPDVKGEVVVVEKGSASSSSSSSTTR